MAFDKLYIVNRMLIAIGDKTLGSLGDDTKSQRLINEIFDGLVDEVFDFPIQYKFATTRAQLTQLTTDPAFGWLYQYGLPEACVRIVATVDESDRTINYPYKREIVVTRSGNNVTHTPVLLCNQEEVFVRYLIRLTNPGYWPGYFRRLVILHGAMQLCSPIKKDDFRSVYLSKEFDKAYLMAKATNGMEDSEILDSTDADLDMGNTDVIDAVQDAEETQTWAIDDT